MSANKTMMPRSLTLLCDKENYRISESRCPPEEDLSECEPEPDDMVLM